MTDRYAAVLTGAATWPAPPGIDPEEFRLALLEDTYEVAAGLEFVTPALILCPPDQPGAEELTWPGTEIIRAGDAPLTTAFGRFRALGGTQAVIIAGDAPDLPPLVLGKLFRALGSAPVAVSPAQDGTLVALAARLPLPPWLTAGLLDLDASDALVRLRAAAGAGQVRAGPGWHRLRTATDLARLDRGLEGWESTRALLAR